MATLHFELVSPERVLFSGEVDQVVLPATEGEMTILAAHSPVMTALTTGFLVLSTGGKTTRILVRGGFADVSPNGLTVLAERAFNEDELNKDVFDKEVETARQELGDAPEDMKHVAEMALAQLLTIQAEFH
ncbi:F0F1 ATP synthase subunit epsilon [Microvirga sp. W0021]|uniref:ATP synthase epsilon chain n=1 Tax=Hohaiivirga grylli TaxID=3133970 RepID=A0ABV0BP37_9HYPH